MSGRSQPWPGIADDIELSRPDGPLGGGILDDTLRERLERAVDAVDAPDAVFAVSRHGRRTLHCGGTATPPPVARQDLRYEIGSATKTFTGLLLARLVQRGLLTGGESAAAFLAPGRRTRKEQHTS
ncbi:serine hydrolase domain-containing protein [Streptomyces sp. NPDC006356]